MSKLQLIDARKMEKFLLSLGFEKTRQKGSHAFFRHKDGRTTTVPYHSGKDLARPLMLLDISPLLSTICLIL